MKTTIDRKTFLDALELTKPGLASREILEQSTHFAFMDDRVVTYNDLISISHPLPLGIEGCIPGKVLLSVLKKDKSKELQVEAVGDQLLIQASTPSYNFNLEPFRNKRLFKQIDKRGPWKKIPDPDKFIIALRLCCETCSKDASNPLFCCIHVNKDLAESTDNEKMTWCNLPEIPIKPFLFSGSSAVDLLKYRPTHIAESKDWVYFKLTQGTEFASRVYNEKYKDLSHIQEQALNLDNAVKVVFPPDTKKMIERAYVFAKRDFPPDECIYLSFQNDKMTIKASILKGYGNNPDKQACFEESARVRVDGDIPEFTTDPKMLLEAINHTPECYIHKNMILFQGEGWNRVINKRTQKSP